jgi:hypothetical protein
MKMERPPIRKADSAINKMRTKALGFQLCINSMITKRQVAGGCADIYCEDPFTSRNIFAFMLSV